MSPTSEARNTVARIPIAAATTVSISISCYGNTLYTEQGYFDCYIPKTITSTSVFYALNFQEPFDSQTIRHP